MLECLEERLTPATPLPARGLVPAFGTGRTSFAQFFAHTNSVANGAVLQADGKVVAVGSAGGDFGAGTGFIVTRYNTHGSPDTSFGPRHTGRTLTAFDEPAVATAVALQSDGKIVVAGYTEVYANIIGDFALARYNKDGRLDTSFGTGGLVTTRFGTLGPGPANVAKSIVIDSAGRIVLGGYTADDATGKGMFALARYTVNGRLDRTFGAGGLVVTSFGVNDYSAIDAVAIDARGRIVVAGYTAAGQDNQGNQAARFALARYNSNGSLDRTFGTGGEVITQVSTGNDDAVNGLAIQPDGKIVAAGWTSNPDTGALNFALARYTSSGSLDRAFGTGGKVVTDFESNGVSAIKAVAIDGQGRIVVAGYTIPGYALNPNNDTTIFALARYTSNGRLDKTFATGGEVGTGFQSGSVSAQCIVRGKNGQLLIVGGGPSDLFLGTRGDFALARYNANGSLDKSFGARGQVSTAFTEPTSSTLDVIAAQPDGKLIVVGGLFKFEGRLGILRLNKDGSLDTTFGSGGEVFTQLSPFGPGDNVAEVVVQPDGKILLVAYYAPVESQGIGHVALLRFNADGSVDTSFGTGGRTPLIELPGQRNGYILGTLLTTAIVQPDGKIVVAAGAGILDLVRFNKDGSLDTSFGSDHTGSVVTAFSDSASAALSLQPDGKIVIAGTANHNLGLARYNANGSLDRTFGAGGVVHSSLPAIGIAGVVLQPGGKIVVGGTGGTRNDFFVARFNSNGSPDKTFGIGGQTFTDFGGSGTASSIVIDSAGRIVLAGDNNYTQTSTPIYVARYSSNGQLDTHFGTRGRLITAFAASLSQYPVDGGMALLLEPQGTLVVAGTSIYPTVPLFAIALAEYAT